MEAFFRGDLCPSEESAGPSDPFHSERTLPRLLLALTSGQDSVSDSAETEIRAFERKNGLIIQNKDGQYLYSLRGGSGRPFLKSKASSEGLKDAQEKIDNLVAKAESKLTEKYKVQFSSNNEDVLRQTIVLSDQTTKLGPMVKARSPQLRELLGLGAALKHSIPGNISSAKLPLKFYFLTDVANLRTGVDALYSAIGPGSRPGVLFDPGMVENSPILERDTTDPDVKGYTVEAVSAHELAHNSEYNEGWDDTYASLQQRSYAMKIGWQLYTDVKNNTATWLLKTQGPDFLKHPTLDGQLTQDWILCDAHARPIDANDKVVSEDQAQHFSAAEAQRLALIKPVTQYFPNPVEMFTEGLMFFRLGPETRSTLLKQSPILYESVKDFDQHEIDHNLGLDSQNRIRFIRDIHGQIVENTSKNRQQVTDFENSVLGQV